MTNKNWDICPCPHCGETNALKIRYGLEERGGYPSWVQCQSCLFCGPVVLDIPKEKIPTAIQAWNQKGNTQSP